MSESVLDDLTNFFENIPDFIRDELCLLLITLSEDELIEQDTDIDYQSAARTLFNAQTKIGQIGNLITAVGIFDVYFALDVAKRFDKACYAGGLEAIKGAGRQWQALRATRLSASAIAAALVPPDLKRKSYRRRGTSFHAAPIEHPTNSVRPT